MELAVVGMGRVGLVVAACLSDFGHRVWGVDNVDSKVAALEKGTMPFYEPGLEELARKNQHAGRLSYTSDLAFAVGRASAIFLAVGTEEVSDGTPNLGPLFHAGEQIASCLKSYTVLVIKSTVPVGTAARWLSHLRARTRAGFDVVSNPEFLREGAAIDNFMRPDRVILGSTSEKATHLLREIYQHLYLLETPFVIVDNETAELIKYATNAFLAAKITFINEMAALCDATGADVHAVARAMGLDKRIGSKFLHPGPGFGGSCLPKDTRTLAKMGRELGCSLPLAESIVQSNCAIVPQLVARLTKELGGLSAKTVAVLGLSYKPFTDDVRESPAMEFVERLLGAGATVRAHDPLANQEAAHNLTQASLSFHDSPFAACQGVDAAAILTEWNEFRSLNLDELRRTMKGSVLLDARNVYDPDEAVAAGFHYIGRGRAPRRDDKVGGEHQRPGLV